MSIIAKKEAKKIGVSKDVSVIDVATHILECVGDSISTMKLQKLVYYCQAWSLVWDEDVIFPEKIEAWANGPVVSELFYAHKGRYRINASQLEGDSSKLSAEQKDTVSVVCETYASKPSQWLSDLTHSEQPWRKARSGTPDGERSQAEITPESILNYYSTL